MTDNVLRFSVTLRQARLGWKCSIYENGETQQETNLITERFCIDVEAVQSLLADCITGRLGACACGSLGLHTMHGGEYRTGVLHPDTGEAELSHREWYACPACGAERKS